MSSAFSRDVITLLCSSFVRFWLSLNLASILLTAISNADDVAQHALAVGLAQAAPLFGIGGFEGADELVEDALQVLRGREHAGVAVDVHGAVVPGGNIFAA